MFYVYILQLKNRINYHKNKLVLTTKKVGFKKMLFYAAFMNKEKALNFEKYLKTSSGFAFRNKRLI